MLSNDAQPRPRIRRRATIAEVARLAGVSPSTVSKVVNNRSGVGVEVRAAVEQAIRTLGYVGLGERQSAAYVTREATIEMLLDPRDIVNPYFATLLSGAMAAAAQTSSIIVLRSPDTVEDQTPTEWAQTLARSGRIGVIEVTSAYSPNRHEALAAAGLPLILIDPINPTHPHTWSIGATNWNGTYTATQHLLTLGHVRINYIGGPAGAQCDIVRSRACAAAVRDAGLVPQPPRIAPNRWTQKYAFAETTELLTSSDPPTAIVAGNDTIAVSVLQAARQVGVTVPDALSVIGFDDTPLAESTTPPLTTVHQPIAEIGRRAVGTVIRLARGEALTPQHIELPTRLTVRATTAPGPLKRHR